MFAPGQRTIMAIHNIPLLMVVRCVQTVNLSTERPILPADTPTTSDPNARGILSQHAYITFYKDVKSLIYLTCSNKHPAAKSILQLNFKFEDTGIGGLDGEFLGICRITFASPIFSPALVHNFGIQHTKGIQLYVPTGAGKR